MDRQSQPEPAYIWDMSSLSSPSQPRAVSSIYLPFCPRPETSSPTTASSLFSVPAPVMLLEPEPLVLPPAAITNFDSPPERIGAVKNGHLTDTAMVARGHSRSPCFESIGPLTSPLPQTPTRVSQGAAYPSYVRGTFHYAHISTHRLTIYDRTPRSPAPQPCLLYAPLTRPLQLPTTA